MILLTSHKTVSREDPAIFFLFQGKGIHGVHFRAIISGIDQDNIIGSVFFTSAAAEKPENRQESKHNSHNLTYGVLHCLIEAVCRTPGRISASSARSQVSTRNWNNRNTLRVLQRRSLRRIFRCFVRRRTGIPMSRRPLH